jgi:hypothetical protein
LAKVGGGQYIRYIVILAFVGKYNVRRNTGKKTRLYCVHVCKIAGEKVFHRASKAWQSLKGLGGPCLVEKHKKSNDIKLYDLTNQKWCCDYCASGAPWAGSKYICDF